MSRDFSDLTCNETLSAEEPERFPQGKEPVSVSRRFQVTPSPNPGNFRVAPFPAQQRTYTAIARPVASRSYTVANSGGAGRAVQAGSMGSASAASLHPVPQLHRSYTVAQPNPQQSAVRKMMQSYVPMDTGEYSNANLGFTTTHSTGFNHHQPVQRVNHHTVLTRDDRILPTHQQPSSSHSSHSQMNSAHINNMFINTMRLQQQPPQSVAPKTGQGTLASLMHRSSSSSMDTGRSPYLQQQHTSPVYRNYSNPMLQQAQSTRMPVGASPILPQSRYSAINNGTRLHPNIVARPTASPSHHHNMPPPMSPAMHRVLPHHSNHHLLPPNPMTSAIPGSPTPLPQLVGHSMSTPSPRPSILRKNTTPGSAAKRKLPFMMETMTTPTNSGNPGSSSPSISVRSIIQNAAAASTSVANALNAVSTGQHLTNGAQAPPTTTEESPRKRPRKQQFDTNAPQEPIRMAIGVEPITTAVWNLPPGHPIPPGAIQMDKKKRGRPRNDANRPHTAMPEPPFYIQTGMRHVFVPLEGLSQKTKRDPPPSSSAEVVQQNAEVARQAASVPPVHIQQKKTPKPRAKKEETMAKKAQAAKDKPSTSKEPPPKKATRNTVQKVIPISKRAVGKKAAAAAKEVAILPKKDPEPEPVKQKEKVIKEKANKNTKEKADKEKPAKEKAANEKIGKEKATKEQAKPKKASSAKKVKKTKKEAPKKSDDHDLSFSVASFLASRMIAHQKEALITKKMEALAKKGTKDLQFPAKIRKVDEIPSTSKAPPPSHATRLTLLSTLDTQPETLRRNHFRKPEPVVNAIKNRMKLKSLLGFWAKLRRKYMHRARLVAKKTMEESEKSLKEFCERTNAAEYKSISKTSRKAVLKGLANTLLERILLAKKKYVRAYKWRTRPLGKHKKKRIPLKLAALPKMRKHKKKMAKTVVTKRTKIVPSKRKPMTRTRSQLQTKTATKQTPKKTNPGKLTYKKKDGKSKTRGKKPVKEGKTNKFAMKDGKPKKSKLRLKRKRRKYTLKKVKAISQKQQPDSTAIELPVCLTTPEDKIEPNDLNVVNFEEVTTTILPQKPANEKVAAHVLNQQPCTSTAKPTPANKKKAKKAVSEDHMDKKVREKLKKVQKGKVIKTKKQKVDPKKKMKKTTKGSVQLKFQKKVLKKTKSSSKKKVTVPKGRKKKLTKRMETMGKDKKMRVNAMKKLRKNRKIKSKKLMSAVLKCRKRRVRKIRQRIPIAVGIEQLLDEMVGFVCKNEDPSDIDAVARRTVIRARTQCIVGGRDVERRLKAQRARARIMTAEPFSSILTGLKEDRTPRVVQISNNVQTVGNDMKQKSWWSLVSRRPVKKPPVVVEVKDVPKKVEKPPQPPPPPPPLKEPEVVDVPKVTTRRKPKSVVLPVSVPRRPKVAEPAAVAPVPVPEVPSVVADFSTPSTSKGLIPPPAILPTKTQSTPTPTSVLPTRKPIIASNPILPTKSKSVILPTSTLSAASPVASTSQLKFAAPVLHTTAKASLINKANLLTTSKKKIVDPKLQAKLSKKDVKVVDENLARAARKQTANKEYINKETAADKAGEKPNLKRKKTMKVPVLTPKELALRNLDQMNRKLEEQMQVENKVLDFFEKFLKVYDPQAHWRLLLDMERDLEPGDSEEVMMSKRFHRLRQTLMRPPITPFEEKKPPFGDVCDSVTINPSEEQCNSMMKGLSPFWRGASRPSNSHGHFITREGKRAIDRSENYIPLEVDHREYYLEDVRDNAEKHKFQRHYSDFECLRLRNRAIPRPARVVALHEPDNSIHMVNRRDLSKQKDKEVLFLGHRKCEFPLPPKEGPAPLTGGESDLERKCRNSREMLATTFKAVRETTLIMEQSRDALAEHLGVKRKQVVVVKAVAKKKVVVTKKRRPPTKPVRRPPPPPPPPKKKKEKATPKAKAPPAEKKKEEKKKTAKEIKKELVEEEKAPSPTPPPPKKAKGAMKQPRAPRTPVTESTFERQIRRAIQESLKNMPSTSKI